MRLRLIAFLLVTGSLGSCDNLATSETSSGPVYPADQSCMNDCLATGGERSFCTQRCTH